MTTNKKSDLLNRAALAIDNSLADSGIRGAVAAYGYSEDKLREGRALLEAAQAAASAQLVADGQQLQATAAFNQSLAVAREAYQTLAKLARATCDKPTLTTLGLVGSEPQNIGGFLKVAFDLFDNAPQVPALADRFGYNADKLAAERARVSALQAADQTQESFIGAAQKATARQQAAFKALEAWLAEYLKIAKVALRADPQQLEKIGVIARTSPTAAHRAARQKKTTPALSKVEEPAAPKS